jgi:hypothetical protein
MKDRITFPGGRRMATWNVYHKMVSKKLVRLGAIEATDEYEAIEKAAIKFKVPADRLVAMRLTG